MRAFWAGSALELQFLVLSSFWPLRLQMLYLFPRSSGRYEPHQVDGEDVSDRRYMRRAQGDARREYFRFRNILTSTLLSLLLSQESVHSHLRLAAQKQDAAYAKARGTSCSQKPEDCDLSVSLALGPKYLNWGLGSGDGAGFGRFSDLRFRFEAGGLGCCAVWGFPKWQYITQVMDASEPVQS